MPTNDEIANEYEFSGDYIDHMEKEDFIKSLNKARADERANMKLVDDKLINNVKKAERQRCIEEFKWIIRKYSWVHKSNSNPETAFDDHNIDLMHMIDEVAKLSSKSGEEEKKME